MVVDGRDSADAGLAQRPLVLVTTRSFSSGSFDATGALELSGYQVRRRLGHDLGEIGDDLAVAKAWIAGAALITDEHLAHGPELRIISRFGTGVDSIDLDAAERRSVVVTNSPGANADAVAELTIALMLSALRDVAAADRRVRAGDWSDQLGRELGACTIGIVGLGRIGGGVARRLIAFGCRVIAYDPWVSDDVADTFGVQAVPIDTLVREADVVSLHTPGGVTIVDTDWIARAKPDQVLVNTARASLIDEVAVARALHDGRLARYASDTLSAELSGQSPLLDPGLSAVTLFTPHAGAHTRQAVDRVGRDVVEAVSAMFAGRRPEHVVNMPRDRVEEILYAAR